MSDNRPRIRKARFRGPRPLSDDEWAAAIKQHHETVQRWDNYEQDLVAYQSELVKWETWIWNATRISRWVIPLKGALYGLVAAAIVWAVALLADDGIWLVVGIASALWLGHLFNGWLDLLSDFLVARYGPSGPINKPTVPSKPLVPRPTHEPDRLKDQGRSGPTGLRFRKWLALCAWFAGCAYCGRTMEPTEYHIDHVVPLSRFGKHDLSNVVPACPQCNMEKHVTSAAEYIARRKGLGLATNPVWDYWEASVQNGGLPAWLPPNDNWWQWQCWKAARRRKTDNGSSAESSASPTP